MSGNTIIIFTNTTRKIWVMLGRQIGDLSGWQKRSILRSNLVHPHGQTMRLSFPLTIPHWAKFDANSIKAIISKPNLELLKDDRKVKDLIKSIRFVLFFMHCAWCSDDIEVTVLINDSSRRSFDAKKRKEEKIEVKVHLPKGMTEYVGE